MKTYSDTLQDAFVLELFGQNKFYLDIGCSNCIEKSNSLLLEENGWDGIMIDSNPHSINHCKATRKSQKIFLADATDGAKMKENLTSVNCPKIIDYFSLDVDFVSLECLRKFPLDDYRFKFMTFEHDIYAGRQETIDRKNITPVFLKEKGYTRLIDNILISPQGAYEDWYISDEYQDLISLFNGKSNIFAHDALNILKESKLKIN